MGREANLGSYKDVAPGGGTVVKGKLDNPAHPVWFERAREPPSTLTH